MDNYSLPILRNLLANCTKKITKETEYFFAGR